MRFIMPLHSHLPRILLHAPRAPLQASPEPLHFFRTPPQHMQTLRARGTCMRFGDASKRVTAI